MNRLALQMSSRSRALAALAAVGMLTTAASFSSPTVASAAQPTQMTVYYNLRDLSTEQGTRALYRRIVNAAETVCVPEDLRDLDLGAASKACQRHAIARAVALIRSPRLAAIEARARGRQG